jgi:hypothetical protein
MDEFPRIWEEFETLRRSLAEAPAPGFGPLFTDRVMRAVSRLESDEASPERFYLNLFAAFTRIGLAGAALAAMFFIWIHILPQAEQEIRDSEQSLEQELESANYQVLEELI